MGEGRSRPVEEVVHPVSGPYSSTQPHPVLRPTSLRLDLMRIASSSSGFTPSASLLGGGLGRWTALQRASLSSWALV